MTTTPDIPAEAVEAASRVEYEFSVAWSPVEVARIRRILAAALPHLRERWLAEVEEALRDEERLADWRQREHERQRTQVGDRPTVMHIADYLRDVLGKEES